MLPCEVGYLYSAETALCVRFFYFVMVVIWFVYILAIGMLGHSTLLDIVAIAPIIIWTWSFYCAPMMHQDIEGELHKQNVLALSLVVALAFFALLEKNFKGNKRLYSVVIGTAIGASLLSVAYIWTTERYLWLTRHLKGALQTIAVFCLIWCIVMFFTKNFSKGLS